MSFIVILFKLILVSFVAIAGTIFLRVYKDFKKLKSAPEWEDTTVFGRIVVSTMFSITAVGLGVLIIFLLYITVSNVTITSYF